MFGAVGAHDHPPRQPCCPHFPHSCVASSSARSALDISNVLRQQSLNCRSFPVLAVASSMPKPKNVGATVVGDSRGLGNLVVFSQACSSIPRISATAADRNVPAAADHTYQLYCWVQALGPGLAAKLLGDNSPWEANHRGVASRPGKKSTIACGHLHVTCLFPGRSG